MKERDSEFSQAAEKGWAPRVTLGSIAQKPPKVGTQRDSKGQVPASGTKVQARWPGTDGDKDGHRAVPKVSKVCFLGQCPSCPCVLSLMEFVEFPESYGLSPLKLKTVLSLNKNRGGKF